MVYVSRIPKPPLDQFIESIWLCQNQPGPVSLQRILPTGTAQLIVNLKEDQIRSYDPWSGTLAGTTSGTILVGVRTRHSVIDTDEQENVMGVVFRPGGTVPFMRVPAHQTCDSDVELDILWGGQSTRRLRDCLLHSQGTQAKLDALEQALADAFRHRNTHPAVAMALHRFSCRPNAASVSAVADAIGLSPKRFIEHFKADVGVTPKRFCRILRFQRALSRTNQGVGIDWSRLALDCGYFDQAHFIHDFRSFSGLTPTEYRAGRTEFQNHVKFLQYAGTAI